MYRLLHFAHQSLIEAYAFKRPSRQQLTPENEFLTTKKHFCLFNSSVWLFAKTDSY